MPRGFGGLRDAAADREARKNSFGSFSNILFFSLNDRETATVRFLEQGEDVQWAYVHQLPPSGNQSFGDMVPCRDQDEEGRRTGADCPGCEQGLKRKERGAINLIWRDAPVYARDKDGKLVKEGNKKVVDDRKDQVAVWKSGPMVFDDLDYIDGSYKGLMSRDFNVTRSGTGLDTEYKISPADVDGGPQAMSASDKKLAEEKYDLAEFVQPPSYETWGKNEFTQQKKETPEPSRKSPFERKRD